MSTITGTDANLYNKTSTLSQCRRCHRSPTALDAADGHSCRHETVQQPLATGGYQAHWCAKAGLRSLRFCAQSRRTVWVVGTELKVIQFSEGGGGMLQSQEFFSIRPSNKWRKTVARVFLLLPCSDQHSPHSLEIRHSYGWVEENRIFFFLQWDTP